MSNRISIRGAYTVY